MMKRLAKSRGLRRFMRSKIAMAALAVIGLYFAIAILVGVFRVITPADATVRVLPSRYPGFLQTPTLDKRFEVAQWFIDRVETKLNFAERRKTDVRPLLDELALVERTVAELPPERLRQLIDEAWEISDEAGEVFKLRDKLLANLDDATRELASHRDPDTDTATLRPVEELRAFIQGKRAEVQASSGEIDSVLTRLEAVVLQIQPLPTGWAGMKYTFRTFLGSDYGGSSISLNAFYSIKVAFQVGIVTATICVFIGTVLGAAAAFFGGWVDHTVMWLVSTMSSIPYLVLLAVLVYMFRGTYFDTTSSPFLSLVPLYTAFCLTFWVGTCRVIRGEVLKIKELEYVQAATSIGFGRFYILLRHVVPNATHLMFINFSLLVIGAIKSEVILTFLGLGVKGQPSWGRMIANGQQEVINFAFWEIGSATVLMFGLVLVFNIVSDALQDAFDPKHVT